MKQGYYTAIVFLKNGNVVKYRNVKPDRKFFRFISKKEFDHINFYSKRTKMFLFRWNGKGTL